MNIIEMEDMVKGLPDQVLFQEAQMPSGRIPQFLALSEVQRRQDMRQRFSARQEQNGTVKDQILHGIGGIGPSPMGPSQMGPEMAPPMAPPMAPQMGPQMGPQMTPPMQPPVQGMAEGGIVKMQRGGISPFLPPASPPPYSPFMPEYMVNAPIIELGPTTEIPGEVVEPEPQIISAGYTPSFAYEQEARDLLKAATPEELEAVFSAPDYSDITARLGETAKRYASEAEANISQMREQAKKDAFAYALMQMGAGLAGGDMARGLERGAEAAFGVLDKSKQQELEERRAARAEARALETQGLQLDIRGREVGAEAKRERFKALQESRNNLASTLMQFGVNRNNAQYQAASLATQMATSLNSSLREAQTQGMLNKRTALNFVQDSVKNAISNIPEATLLTMQNSNPNALNDIRRQATIEAIDLAASFIPDFDPDEAKQALLRGSSAGSMSSNDPLPGLRARAEAQAISGR